MIAAHLMMRRFAFGEGQADVTDAGFLSRGDGGEVSPTVFPFDLCQERQAGGAGERSRSSSRRMTGFVDGTDAFTPERDGDFGRDRLTADPWR